MCKSPIDLLPIKRPLEDDNFPEETFFYNNVIKELIPDVLRFESNGIPINLNKVTEVENTVNDVLTTVRNKLANNKLMNDFLNHKDIITKNKKYSELEAKQKTYEDFIKPFNPKNKTHRSFVVNQYLLDNNKNDMTMDEWSIKDLKKLNQIIASKFITDLLDNNIQDYMNPIIDKAMINLATIKANTYNKNIIEVKKDKISNSRLIDSFNPGSAQQKQEFFNYYNIESESETKTGNPQWNREELEKLQQLLSIMIKDKE